MNAQSWIKKPWRVAGYWGTLFLNAAKNWSESKSVVYAAALAFFTVFSIAPAIIVAVAVAGVVLGEANAEGQLIDQVAEMVGPEAADFVAEAIVNMQLDQGGLLATVVGVVMILVGATTVFYQLQESLNSVWGVVPNPDRNNLLIMLKQRLISLGVVIAIGFFLLMTLLLSVTVQALISYAEQWIPIPGWVLVAVDALLSVTSTTFLFAAVFKVLPAVLLRWSEVLLGGFITALLFMVGSNVLALYLTSAAIGSTYGAAGSLVILLIWVHYSSMILLYGAALCRAHLEAMGRPLRPAPRSARVWRKFSDE